MSKIFIKFIYRVFFFAILFNLFFSCKNDFGNNDYNLEILSPKSNWTYSNESLIVFSCNVSGQGLFWYSSLQGKIGQGREITARLLPGIHEITLKDEVYNKTASLFINVQEKENALSLITAFPFIIDEENQTENLKVKAGIISLDGKVEDLEFQFENLSENSENEKFLSNTILKDIPIDNKISALKVLTPDFARSALTAESKNKKDFYVIDTSNSYSDAHELCAEKFYEDERLSIWLPENYNFDINLINEIIENLQGNLLKHVNQLWGDCADVNQDGTFAILFSPTINDEKVAVGFFNSADFFENNRNTSSKSYNPYSNEMDILYIAAPEKGSKNYNVKSITATIVHEYTHAINFTNKTWKKIFEGNNDVVQEETFLDEGCSHLTESLCGYGISGGNCDFVNLYLSNMNLYSFCKKNYLGNSDSAGQRGAMTLFLYYLFNKAGGIEYSNDQDFLDKGGISFLKSIINSSVSGWNSIGEYFSKTTDWLFLEFAQEILSKNMTEIFDFDLKDPFTGENIFSCNEIKLFSLSEKYNVLPYSVFAFDLVEKTDILKKIDASGLEGTLYFYWKN